MAQREVEEKMPQIQLLGILSSKLDESPENILLSCLKGTRSELSSNDQLKGGTTKKDYELLREAISRRHFALAEKIKCEISYKYLPYFVAMQMALFSYFDILQQSFRRTSPKFIFVPEVIKESKFHSKVKNHLDYVLKNYYNFVEKGVDPKEARYMLPMLFDMNMSVGGNLREFFHFILMSQSDDVPHVLRDVGIKTKSQIGEYVSNLLKIIDDSDISLNDFHPTPNLFSQKNPFFNDLFSNNRYKPLIENCEKTVILDLPNLPENMDSSTQKHYKISQVSKVSMYLLHQLSRHRTWVISPETLRQAASHYEFSIPPSVIRRKLKQDYIKIMNSSYNLFTQLKDGSQES